MLQVSEERAIISLLPSTILFSLVAFLFRVWSCVHKTYPLGSSSHAKIAFMQVTVNVPDRLAAEARARGVSVEVYVEEMLVRQLIVPEGETPQKSVGESIDRIRELRKQNTLGDLKTKDLIHEGHKY